MKKLIVVAALMIALTGCTASQMGNVTSLGKDHTVKQYSGGVLIGEWSTRGKVTTISDSDGWEFVDRATGKFMRVSGDVQVSVK
jgi:hypothetical protein